MMKISRLTMMFLLILVMLSSCAKPVRTLTSDELLDLGEKYLLELDYEQAVVQFLAVIEIEPMNERAYIGAVEAYRGLDNIDQAIRVLQEALEQLPSSTVILTMLNDLLTSITIPETPEESLPNISEAEEPRTAQTVNIVSADVAAIFTDLEAAILADSHDEINALIMRARTHEFIKTHHMIKMSDLIIYGNYQVYYLGRLSNGTGKFIEINTDNNDGFFITLIDMKDYAFTGEYDHVRYDAGFTLSNHRYGYIANGKMEPPYFEDFYTGYINDVYTILDEPHHIQFDEEWAPYGNGQEDTIKRLVELENGHIAE